jgi:hypothetical protein
VGSLAVRDSERACRHDGKPDLDVRGRLADVAGHNDGERDGDRPRSTTATHTRRVPFALGEWEIHRIPYKASDPNAIGGV